MDKNNQANPEILVQQKGDGLVFATAFFEGELGVLEVCPFGWNPWG